MLRPCSSNSRKPQLHKPERMQPKKSRARPQKVHNDQPLSKSRLKPPSRPRRIAPTKFRSKHRPMKPLQQQQFPRWKKNRKTCEPNSARKRSPITAIHFQAILVSTTCSGPSAQSGMKLRNRQPQLWSDFQSALLQSGALNRAKPSNRKGTCRKEFPNWKKAALHKTRSSRHGRFLKPGKCPNAQRQMKLSAPNAETRPQGLPSFATSAVRQ